MPVAAPEVRELVRSHIVRRVVPEIERYFQFPATRMDRYVIACYDSAVGGHFHRHRDNVNAGARHRRFALSINLNSGFEGGDLVFPEFGRRTYRPPEGGALLFSCGALHQVTPVTAGRRYAFSPSSMGRKTSASAKPTTRGCISARRLTPEPTTGCFQRRPKPPDEVAWPQPARA